MAEVAKTNGAAKATPQVATRPETQLELVKRTVVDVVKNKIAQFISSGELYLPQHYSPDNAMKAAWLVLQETKDKNGSPVLVACDRDSVASSLLDMVVQGLNPIKKQCYFIAYGKHLTCQRSYFGSMAVAKEVQSKIDDFAFAVVYEGDTFKYGIKNGRKTVTEHEQDIANIDKAKIVAAYCIALDKDGEPWKTEIMTFEEIKQSWRQSQMNPIEANGKVKEGSTHGEFAADMALKTVINKLCKAIINASSDNNLLLERVRRSEDLADRAQAEVEIELEANTGAVIDISTGAALDPTPKTKEEERSEIPAEEPPTDAVPKAERRIPGF